MKISKLPPFAGLRLRSAGLILGLLCLFTVSAAAAGPSQRPESGPFQFVTIGSGQVNGIYYPISQALCRILNRKPGNPVLLTSVERTRGSVYNLRAISAGVFEFGLAQSDHLATAYRGREPFKNRLAGLRTLFSLYEEIFTVVVKADSPIYRFEDLKHQRISTGRPGSGGYATMLALFASSNWQPKEISQINTLNYSGALDELCRNKVDAMIFTGGHPFQPLIDADQICRLRLLPVTGPAVDRLLHQTPGYNYTTIPAGLYPDFPTAVASFGVTATLVTSTRTSDELVYQVARRVMENLARLRLAHPVLQHLTRKKMVSSCRAAPFHPGALRYYRECGLLSREQTGPACRPQATRPEPQPGHQLPSAPAADKPAHPAGGQSAKPVQ